MRKRIDAHVHIRPEHLCGTTDPYTGVAIRPYGQMVFPDGEVYQFMPPYFRASAFTADDLIALLDAYHIDRAVIMQAINFEVNADVAAAVRRYPERLAGAMVIRPKNESVLDEVAALHQSGLTAMKFEMNNKMGHTSPGAFPDFKFNSPLMHGVLALCQKLGVTVTVDPSLPGGPGYQVEALDEVVRAYPTLRFVICHLGFAKAGMEADAEKYARWQAMCALARHENVWFDVSAIPDLFLAEGWPFAGGLDVLAGFVKQYGSTRVLWGSDIPGTLNSATYPQMIDMFERDARFSEADKDRLFGLNARDAYF